MRIVLTEFARPRLFPRVPRPNTIQDITAREFEQELKSAQADSPDDKPKPPPAA